MNENEGEKLSSAESWILAELKRTGIRKTMHKKTLRNAQPFFKATWKINMKNYWIEKLTNNVS